MITINNILVAVDFSKESNLAARYACSLAKEYKATLHVMHVYDPLRQYDYLAEEFMAKRKAEFKEALSNFIPPEVKEVLDVKEILEEAKPVHHTIVERAAQIPVDVIVVATHGRTGLAHVLLGSVAEHIIRHAPCPVLVIRQREGRKVETWEDIINELKGS